MRVAVIVREAVVRGWLHLAVLVALILSMLFGGCATARPTVCACSCDEAGLRVVERLQGENQRLRAQLDFWRDQAVRP